MHRRRPRPQRLHKNPQPQRKGKRLRGQKESALSEPQFVWPSDPVRKALFALNGTLKDVENRHGIPRSELLPRLFPRYAIFPDGVRLEFPFIAKLVRPQVLSELEKRIAHYRAALASLVHEQETVARSTEESHIRALLDHSEGLLTELRSLRRWAKLEPGKRVGLPDQWAKVGDAAADLALFLSAKVPGRWTRGKGVRGARAPRPYKVVAIELAAELLTHACCIYLPGFRITPQQVKARVTARRTLSR